MARINKAGDAGTHKDRALLFTSIGHFSNDGMFLLFTLLIVYYSEIGVSLVLLGFFAIFYNLLSGIVTPKVGSVVGRSDRGTFIAFGIAIEGLAVVLFAASFAFHSLLYEFMLLGLIALGVGQAFYHPIGSSVLSHTYGSGVPQALGINGAMGSIGRTVFPIFITLAIAAYGTSIGLNAVAGVVFVLAAVLYLGLRMFSQRYYKSYSPKTRKGPDYAHALKENSGFIKSLTTVIFFRSLFMIGTETFIAEYVFNIIGSNVIVGTFLTLSFIPAVLGQLFFGRFAQKYSGRAAVVVTTIFEVPAFVVFLMVSNIAYLIIAYGLFTFLAFTGFAVIFSYVDQVIPQRHVTAIGAKVWGIGDVLGGAAGIIVATLLLYAGLTLAHAMWAMVAFGVLSIALLPLLRK
ncbi:MAG: MFS transporter [Candidatus Micrarchaeaceae archaeon]